MLGSSLLAAQLAASQEGLNSMSEWVSTAGSEQFALGSSTAACLPIRKFVQRLWSHQLQNEAKENSTAYMFLLKVVP
jgi:hypothetical protein